MDVDGAIYTLWTIDNIPLCSKFFRSEDRAIEYFKKHYEYIPNSDDSTMYIENKQQCSPFAIFLALKLKNNKEYDEDRIVFIGYTIRLLDNNHICADLLYWSIKDVPDESISRIFTRKEFINYMEQHWDQFKYLYDNIICKYNENKPDSQDDEVNNYFPEIECNLNNCPFLLEPFDYPVENTVACKNVYSSSMFESNFQSNEVIGADTISSLYSYLNIMNL